jgi:hypothetical protein
MARYMLGVIQPTGGSIAADDLDEIMRDVEAVSEELRAAGGWVFAAGLHDPSTATVVRPHGDEVLMTDGPFAEGKEHLGGFTIVDAPDLDAALGWATRFAHATRLPIEVRPVQEGS